MHSSASIKQAPSAMLLTKLNTIGKEKSVAVRDQRKHHGHKSQEEHCEAMIMQTYLKPSWHPAHRGCRQDWERRPHIDWNLHGIITHGIHGLSGIVWIGHKLRD